MPTQRPMENGAMPSAEREAFEAARLDSMVSLTAGTWRELETRAATLGIDAELLADGGELRVAVDLPGSEEPAPE